jgi:predicted nucleic acid-binding protein
VACVLDASALASALLGRSAKAVGLRQRLVAESCHAPHLIDAEVGNVLWRQVLQNRLIATDAETLLVAGAALIDHRYEMTGALARTAWNLRDNVTFYDGLYVALATALSVPLLTADERLARTPRLACAVEQVGLG